MSQVDEGMPPCIWLLSWISLVKVWSVSHFFTFFNRLPKKSASTIRLFGRDRHCYAAYGDDALYIAEQFYQTKAVVKLLVSKASTSSLEYVIMQEDEAITFMRDALTNRKLRIEIWARQEGEESDASKNKNQFILKHEVLGACFSNSLSNITFAKASPGNIQSVEDLILVGDNTDTDAELIAIQLGFTRVASWTPNSRCINVGIAYVNRVARRLVVAEFLEDDSFSSLEVCETSVS